MSEYHRFDELQLAIRNNQIFKFIETIEDLKELKVVETIITNDQKLSETELEKFNSFKERIEKYQKRSLNEFDFTSYPLTFNALSKPGGKIAIFLFADYVNEISIQMDLFPLVEYILKQFNFGFGKKQVNDEYHEFNQLACDFMSSYKQYHCQLLRRILFPELKRSVNSANIFHWYFE